MYVKFLPSEYVLRYKRGKIVGEGVGLSFFYMEKTTSACSIPVSNTDADFIFNEQTQDFQTVAVQGQITYRICDYRKVAGALDFTVNLKTKQYNHDPMAKLSKRIINIAEVILKNHISELSLTQAVRGNKAFADAVLEEMRSVEELAILGVEVSGVSILQIAPSSETMRALEAKTREEILKQSDDALYERRNASIEQERKVKENELNTEISVEEKKKKIRESEIATKRMILEKENEFEILKAESNARREKIKIEAEIEVERKRKELAELRMENAKKDADAEAYRISAVMQAYNQLSKEVLVALATLNMEPEKMIARAFEKLAATSGKIGTLNITPDLLESLTKGKRA